MPGIVTAEKGRGEAEARTHPSLLITRLLSLQRCDSLAYHPANLCHVVWVRDYFLDTEYNLFLVVFIYVCKNSIHLVFAFVTGYRFSSTVPFFFYIFVYGFVI